MAISVRAAGTWADSGNNGTTQTVAIPDGTTTGDLMLCAASIKPYTATPTIDEGWAELYVATGGSTANGNGTGSQLHAIFYKVHTGTEANPTITWGVASSPGAAVIISLQKGAGEAWLVNPLAAAPVEQAAQNLSINLTTNRVIASGDWVFALASAGDDSAAFTRTTTAISGAAVTWNGNYVEYPVDHLTTTTGNDMAADLGYRMVTTGAASGATITVTAALSASERAQASIFRVNVISQTTVTGSFTANSIRRATVAGSLTADAITRRTMADSFAAAAIIGRTQPGAFYIGNNDGTGGAVFVAGVATIQDSTTADAVLRSTAQDSFAADAVLATTSTTSTTADAIVFVTVEQSFLADAVIPGAATTIEDDFDADSTIGRVGRCVWTHPDDGDPITSTPELRFLMPPSAGEMYFWLELDRSDTFDSGSLRTYKTTLDQAGWEYWDGDSWEPMTGGVPNTFSSNEARFTVSDPLGSGTWYRRVRAGTR